MEVTQEQLNEINRIQLDIFKEFSRICSELDLKYYAVHGTLLGAIKHNGFCPFDDDIDVAMPRKDYDIFLSKGAELIKSNYFIQSYKSEEDYPLVFAKIRDNNTSFIQPKLKNLNINQGIYIDIFPIDYYPTNLNKIFCSIKQKICSARISNRIINKHESIVFKIIKMISLLFIPSYSEAVRIKANCYRNIKKSDKCIVYGGKKNEININYNLFGEGKKVKFEDTSIIIPDCYEKYLSLIYGDYDHYAPMGKYMVSEEKVIISAENYDTKNSFTKYL